jgi:transposase
MKLHSNAALTVAQRREVKRLFEEENVSIKELAKRFCVHPNTIRCWIRRDSAEDRSSKPKHIHTVITPQYEQAIVTYREQNPGRGAIRIALALQGQFPFANRGTVATVLKKHGLTRPAQRRPKGEPWHIPVGHYRLQMDVQQLPAVRGGQGFEYKISLIHLATRWKYSEIHGEATSETVSAVYRRALDSLPPFLSPGPTMP